MAELVFKKNGPLGCKQQHRDGANDHALPQIEMWPTFTLAEKV